MSIPFSHFIAFFAFFLAICTLFLGLQALFVIPFSMLLTFTLMCVYVKVTGKHLEPEETVKKALDKEP